MRVLLVELEFLRWKEAAHWSYSNQLAIEEGLKAQGVHCQTITTPWVGAAQEVLKNESFDQVWIEIVHQEFDSSFWSWIKNIAPIRIGLIAESLGYHPNEHAINTRLKQRKEKVWEYLQHLTHVVASDECDVKDISSSFNIPAFWWRPSIPKRCITYNKKINTKSPAVFCGAIYGERLKYINNVELKGLLTHRSSPDGYMYPFMFDMLHWISSLFHRFHLPGTKLALKGYLAILRCIRRACFDKWLDSMRKGCAVVNLPHLLKAYPGRVVEAMAVGVPVISWKVPNRPKTESLFVDEKEILFYDKENTTTLKEQIRRVQTQDRVAALLIENARQKVSQLHTIEKRVEEILLWIQTGVDPYDE